MYIKNTIVCFIFICNFGFSFVVGQYGKDVPLYLESYSTKSESSSSSVSPGTQTFMQNASNPPGRPVISGTSTSQNQTVFNEHDYLASTQRNVASAFARLDRYAILYQLGDYVRYLRENYPQLSNADLLEDVGYFVTSSLDPFKKHPHAAGIKNL